MHESSIVNMKHFVDKYLSDKKEDDLVIYDIGAQDIYGCYRPLLQNSKWEYVGVDLASGSNIDITLSNPYDWKEILDNSADVVISGQTFEHIEYIWLSIQEITRILKPGGLCCIIAPSTGPEHRHPVDCWRIYPDGYRALARWCGLEFISADFGDPQKKYSDNSSQWSDISFIAQKSRSNTKFSKVTFSYICDLLSFQPKYIVNAGWTGHLFLANLLIKEIRPNIFVELGVERGESYFSFCQSITDSQLSTQAYAIDTWKGDIHTGFYNEDCFTNFITIHESDYKHCSNVIRSTFSEAKSNFEFDSIELLHIDGTHSYEAVKEDFETWLPYVKAGGIILFHDTQVIDKNFGVNKLWKEIKDRADVHSEFTDSNGLGLWRKPGGAALNSEILTSIFTQNPKNKKELIELLINLSHKYSNDSNIENKQGLLYQQQLDFFIQNEKFFLQRQYLKSKMNSTFSWDKLLSWKWK